MSLNPFAKEYVPGAITKGVSSLKITGSNEAQPDDQVAPRASEHNLRGALDLRCMGASRVSIVKVQPRAAKPPMAPKTIPKERASEDLDFEELFQGSPSDKGSATATKVPSVDLAEEFGRELQAHQDLHNVMPPNPHTGSPSVMGLDNEKDVLETVGSDYVKSPEDIQDIKDAISVPESEIQDTEEQDVISRPAGQIAEGDDPEDVEEEVKRGHSVARQGSVFPHGLQQAEDVAASISRKLSPQDFEMLTVLGQGAFGKVFLVSKRDTGEIFAMKVMRKNRILERDHEAYVAAEREVLTAVVHPYIVTLQYSFQTSSKLYLLLDFINGGHLFFQLYREGIFSEDLARLYCAEIVLAISHLHSCGFVHRDLKPENVLLDSEGHVKITDFGLSKKNIDDDTRTNSFIGTLEYMAPEVVIGNGHGKSVDWWSVGILLFEMLVGMPPFRAKNQQALKKQITTGKIKFPTYLSTQSLSILKGFLIREPKNRLGYGSHGGQDVMKHPFFKTINWDKLYRREIPSPFRPIVKSSHSVENFDKIWTDLPPEDSPCATPDHPGLKEAFKDFSYYGRTEMMNRAANMPNGSAKSPEKVLIEKPFVPPS